MFHRISSQLRHKNDELRRGCCKGDAPFRRNSTVAVTIATEKGIIATGLLLESPQEDRPNCRRKNLGGIAIVMNAPQIVTRLVSQESGWIATAMRRNCDGIG